MVTSISNVQTVGADEYPFYVQEEAIEEPKDINIELADVPQGMSSRLDSDTVDGIQAVTSDKAAPNKLVATGDAGTLPTSVIPSLPTSVIPRLTGQTVQIVQTLTTAMSTTAGTIPYDNTIPQITEGGEVMTRAITPTSATNELLITVVTYTTNGTTNRTITALFQDATANALAAAAVVGAAVDNLACATFLYKMTAGTTSSTTFRVRVGAASGTTTFNGESGTAFLGGIASSITIAEIQV